MAKLKTMYALIVELLEKLRDDAETRTIPFVLESEQEGVIEVYAEDTEEGLVHYHITVNKEVTVKQVRDDFTENDLVNVATVEGKKVSNNKDICCGSLLQFFAGSEDPINGNYDADFFRFTVQRAMGRSLGLILD